MICKQFAPTNTRVTYTELVVLLLAIFICLACSNSNATDGDEDIPDGDKESDSDSNPCNSPLVDCFPGTCKSNDGNAECNCPAGYRVAGYKCVLIVDGDKVESDIDPEQEINTDGDIDKDPEETTEYESCKGETDGPFRGIPCCSDVENVYPCMAELEFEYTNDRGEFRVGLLDVNNLWL